MFEMHEKAIINVNESANSLIDLLEEIPLPKQNDTTFGKDLYSTATITDEHILDMKFSLSNGLGEEVCKYFYKEDVAYGFINESYQMFCSIAQKIYRNKGISKLISFEYLKEKLFTWIQNAFVQDEKVDFYDNLSEVCFVDVVEREIIIPVPFTLAEKEFCFGGMVFKPLTEQMIDDWFEQANSNKKESIELQQFEIMKMKVKQEIQGYIAGIFVCTAEPLRAKELAYEKLSKNLSFLRLLSHANFHYKAICPAHEYGKSFIINATYLSIKRTNFEMDYVMETLDKTILWNIETKIIDYVLSGPFQKANELLLIETPNDFQDKLLNAVIIYSKHTISHEIYDKILYILVAIETMLLKTDTEPIQQNIGQRLAYLIGSGLEERKCIIKTIKDIYSIRSKYIHHGIIDFKDDELMKKFMLYVWQAFSKMIEFINTFETREKFIEYLDNLLLS